MHRNVSCLRPLLVFDRSLSEMHQTFIELFTAFRPLSSASTIEVYVGLSLIIFSLWLISSQLLPVRFVP